MTLSTDSYLEYFLTLLGWLINNGVFSLFVGTGIWLLPLLGILLKTWKEVIKQGDDEGEKGENLIRQLSAELFPAMLVVIFALAPVIPITLSNMEYNVDRSKQCGYRVPLKPENSGYSDMVTTLSGREARIPILWAFMHKVNKGFNYGLISFLPCQRDLRQIRFEVQHQKINNPALLTEVRQFVQQCYVPARHKVQSSQLSLTPAQVRETSWLGGKILIQNPELYPRYRAQQPNKLFAYDRNRDVGLPNNGEGGFPTCDQWWADGEVGLKPRLLADLRQNLSAMVSDFFNSADNRDEVLLKTVVRPENIDVSRGMAYQGYGGDVDFSLSDAAIRLTAGAGSLLGSFAVFPGLDSMRQSLPMIQAFMIMTIIILMPVIIILSSFSVKSVVTLIFVYFALITTTFWWELARWLDTFIIQILYSSPAHPSLNAYFFENMSDDLILKFVMGTLFIIVPGIWFASMAWAGVRVGGIVDGFANGSKQTQKSGEIGGGLVKSKFSK